MADVVQLRTPETPAVSPDGRRVAFGVYWSDTTANATSIDLWIGDVDGGSPARPFVGEPENESNPQWSPDGARLAFTMCRDGTCQVWAVPANGDQPSRISRSRRSVESYRWTPDGSAIVYLAETPLTIAERREISERRRRRIEVVVESDPPRPRAFYRQTLDKTAATELAPAGSGAGDWDLHPDGTRIVYSSNTTGLKNDEPLFDLFEINLETGVTTRLTERHGPDTSPRYSPDGAWIAFKADQDSSVTFSQEEVWILRSGDGSGARCLSRAWDHSVVNPAWNADGTAVRVETALHVDNTYLEFPLDGEAGHLERTRGPDAPSFATELHATPDDRVLAWVGEGPGSWADIWVAVDDEAPRQLTDLNPNHRARAWPRISATAWTSSDGLRIAGLLAHPPERTPGPPYATIAFPHGGPFNRSTNRLRGLRTSIVLASAGYLVFLPNYRGSKGWSESFGQANREDFGGGDIQDIFTGLNALIESGLADSSRLGILGGSYGGYLTNRAVTLTNRFKAAVSMYGIASLITDMSNSASPSYETEYLGGPFWEKMDLYLERSPISRVQHIRTPILLLHGDRDRATTIAGSYEIWTALRLLKRPVEFVHYPREGHGFREPNTKIDAARRTVEWFDRYLGDPDP